jgi:hypothetical protein
MSKPKTTLAILFAIVIAVGFVVSSSGFVIPALAQRGGGQSDNGCGLTGESAVATGLGRELGAGTSSAARSIPDFGQQIAGFSSGCSP